jgi:NAD(P)-dependent dehydrogenase (short-subunit alcohol dehydrogenase family)
MSQQQEQQVWLITGASSGLGFHIAKKAMEAGHKVIAGYRTKTKSPDNITELEKMGAIWVQLDVALDAVEDTIKDLISQHGRVDVLINNAGYLVCGALEQTRFVTSLS